MNFFIIDCSGYLGNALNLVTLQQMINSLVNAVENPTAGIRIVEVQAIKKH